MLLGNKAVQRTLAEQQLASHMLTLAKVASIAFLKNKTHPVFPPTKGEPPGDAVCLAKHYRASSKIPGNVSIKRSVIY